jgi:hypothetical protein
MSTNSGTADRHRWRDVGRHPDGGAGGVNALDSIDPERSGGRGDGRRLRQLDVDRGTERRGVGERRRDDEPVAVDGPVHERPVGIADDGTQPEREPGS